MQPAHFGFRHRPFAPTPDVSAYYPSTPHERALARLREGVEDGEGILLLLGGPGTGKTLLAQVLLDRLGPERPALFLIHSHFADRRGLLQALLFDLGLPHEGRGEQELRLALVEHLLQRIAEGRPLLVVIDEAHHLTADLLEELRLLGNLESPAGRAVQLLLLGLPELWERVCRPESEAFRQRLAVRAALDPLGLEEAADYLLHQVRAAGARPEAVFLDEAVEVLAHGTRGVPRLLNQAARQALALAAQVGADHVDVEAALEGLVLLGLEDDPEAIAPEGEPSVLALPGNEPPAEGPAPEPTYPCPVPHQSA